MNNTELTIFFDNIGNTNNLTLRKKISDLTNNYESDSFCDLNKEFIVYCISRVIKELDTQKKTNELTKIVNEIRKNDDDFFKSFPLNTYITDPETYTVNYNRTRYKHPKIAFDYRDLISELGSFQEIMHEIYTSKIQPQQISIKPPKLIGNKISINQIALKCFYEGKIITRENAKEQLINTGYKSGDKLYNVFSKWSNTTDRKADPESKVKLNNKIELFKSVIELLPEEKKRMANDDLKILSSFISKY